MQALKNLSEWSVKWQLTVNVDKCIVLHIGKNNPKLNYFINGFIIQSSDHVRDLGVEVDNLLKFDYPIENIVSRAYQRLAILFKGFISRDSKLLTKAYITYVRPILEYCSSVWSQHYLKDIDALEQVQRYFTRRLIGFINYNRLVIQKDLFISILTLWN